MVGHESANLLLLNITKTKFMTFSSRSAHLPQTTKIIIHEPDCLMNPCKCINSVNRSDSVKYLGVYIDQHMKWDMHISYINKKKSQNYL